MRREMIVKMIPMLGRKRGRDMTNTTAIRQHVAAVTRLLLGKQTMQLGVAILGGEPLKSESRLELARMAAESRTDLVHLEFGTAEDDALEIVGINLVAPREARCYFHTGCRLWLGASARRALILPQCHIRGHFRLTADELIHVDGKPANGYGSGMLRASTRVHDLARRGASALDMFAIHELDAAA